MKVTKEQVDKSEAEWKVAADAEDDATEATYAEAVDATDEAENKYIKLKREFENG